MNRGVPKFWGGRFVAILIAIAMTGSTFGRPVLPAKKVSTREAVGAASTVPTPKPILATRRPMAVGAMTPEQDNALFGVLQAQAHAIEQALEGRMPVVVLATDDPIVRQFIASGILHTNDERFNDNVFSGMLVAGGEVNGVRVNACYVLFDRGHAAYLWQQFLVPVVQRSDWVFASAYLIGHEVGHCLDSMEINNRFAGSESWSLGQAGAFGIQPDAWQRVGGGAETVTHNDYLKRKIALFSDPAQRQFQERVADAFGVLWAWRQGAPRSLLEGVRAVRSAYSQSWDGHATLPALIGLEEFESQSRAATVADLWVLARGLQVRAGVDSHLVLGGDHGQNAPLVSRAVVVSRPVPTAPTPDAQGRLRFDALPRFGASANTVTVDPNRQ